MLRNSLLVIFMIVFGSLGMFVSIIASLTAKMGFPNILINALTSVVCMAGLGGGTYFLIQWKIPELLTAVEEEGNILEDHDQMEGSMATSTDNMPDGISKGSLQDISKSSQKVDTSVGLDKNLSQGHSRKNKNITSKDGNITVEGVTLQNKPELMAEAIRQVLDQDDEN